jgi:hypothetical protein
MSHSSLQWWGWVPPRELAEQRRGMIPRRVMAQLYCVRALNACTRVWEQVRSRGSLERGEARSRVALALDRGGTRSRGALALERGGTRSRGVLAPERGGTRSREVLALERGGTRSRGPLIGPLQWAAGATAAWAVPCVHV